MEGFPDNPMFSASPERLRALADELEKDGEHDLAASARRAADEDDPPVVGEPDGEG